MTSRAEKLLLTGYDMAYRALAGDASDDHAADEGHGHGAGVHVEYADIYAAIIFFTAIYAGGVLCSKFLKMPNLVGEIFVGIILGPPVLDYVPYTEAFVLLGEIGLILLVVEAGVDIDLVTLKLIGARGIIIALVGSILPIAIALGLSYAVGEGHIAAIAGGASFAPTSLGIALNILKVGNLVNTPVGQLIVSAAVIDDMIALVILSQLQALTGEVSISGIVVPIVSSIGFLLIGGFAAIFIFPVIIDDYILIRFPEKSHPWISMGIMFGMVLGLMPACKAADASYLMGVFIAGLTFAKNHEVHHFFGLQFKRVLQWLMRIFFAASIGFQVPITSFGKASVIGKGFLFTLALLGKLAVGFMVPNFSQGPKFRGSHLRDAIITGLSMAAEGEIAFVIAVFAFDNDLITQELYASIVFAILLSTIVPPFFLRFTISRYNKKKEEMIQATVTKEMKKKLDLDKSEHILAEDIQAGKAIFLCIQMQCESRWGLLPAIMATLQRLHLDVIDHRSWHPPRGADSTLVNEIYAKGSQTEESPEDFLTSVQKTIFELIKQSDARVKVTRWHPGVETEITEEVDRGTGEKKVERKLSVSAAIMQEAQAMLEKKQHLQLNATKEKTVEEILGAAIAVPDVEAPPATGVNNGVQRRKRRVRVRTMSTPVVGGDLFAGKTVGVEPTPISRPLDIPTLAGPPGNKVNATLKVGNETFQIQVSSSAVDKARHGKDLTLNSRDLSTSRNKPAMATFNLDGYIRKPVSMLPTVSEQDSEIDSELGSTHDL